MLLKGADLKGCAVQGSGRITHKENENVVLQLRRLGPHDYGLVSATMAGTHGLGAMEFQPLVELQVIALRYRQ